jgi:tRNA pseudouridine55 synthase
VIRLIRRLFKTRRVGHSGTLDPLATGVLPVALGDGTRLIQFLMEGDKTYRATLKLGEITDTQDCEGEVLESRAVEGVDETVLEKARRSFLGDIKQVPPMYSALKKNGVALHRLARKGIEVERAARKVRITRLDILEVRLPFITLEVDCSKGTYVRTLCHDMGLALGCGAHLTALRRTRNGPFGEDRCVSLEMLQNDPDGAASHLLSLAEAIPQYPALQVAESAGRRLANGIPPELDQVSGALPAAGDLVKLIDGDTLLAIARYAPSRGVEKRGDFELLRVFNRSSG